MAVFGRVRVDARKDMWCHMCKHQPLIDTESTMLAFPTPLHQCLLYKPLDEFQISSSKCLLWEGQTAKV